MPIRDFECTKCQYKFEVIINKKEDEPVSCPRCNEKTLQLCWSFPATYFINGDNSASVRPKKSRSTE